MTTCKYGCCGKKVMWVTSICHNSLVHRPWGLTPDGWDLQWKGAHTGQDLTISLTVWRGIL
jgi:hypothetical protein